jgi:hypothetical protein
MTWPAVKFCLEIDPSLSVRNNDFNVYVRFRLTDVLATSVTRFGELFRHLCDILKPFAVCCAIFSQESSYPKTYKK